MELSRSFAVSLLNTTDNEFSSGETETLDARMLQALAKSTVVTGMEKEAVMEAIQYPSVTSDPEKLFKIQLATSDYNIKVSLISTLTRKATSAVETLLRA
ncbi:type III secretion system inner rod subunit SctI [[Erwinia] mediterraneensis]|uniref:type III secretion system inner rod subunit SctI n=1 Tax=[Erwinia] mediterraneensis TaxID=2161819 RepID=UPI002351F06D|nr:type III secretion system inner rod subunit SctI [[Erwinia] mediterraneensis]